MKTEQEVDKIHAVQVENRHLKETIVALRERLEALRFEKDEAVQQAIAISNDEIVQLKQTATALRGELEKTVHQYEVKIEENAASFRDEIRQLQQAVAALRGQLEEEKK